MPNIVCIDIDVHKSNLNEAMDRALQSQAKKVVFIGLDLALVKTMLEAGRDVALLPAGSALPEGAVNVPFFPGTERSRAFVAAQKIAAAGKS